MSEQLRDPDRLAALARTRLMDSDPERAFDRLTEVASRLLKVPVALVSLVDGERQFFKSRVGLELAQTPLSHSFCQHVVVDAAPLIVADARTDPRLRENLAIAELGVVAYCGVPLTDPDGHTLGSFCAIADKPRQWSDSDVAVLEELAASVMGELELRAAYRALSDREAQVRLSEMRFRRTFDDSPIGIALVSPDGRWLTVNHALCAIVGYSEPELMGLNFQAITHPEDLDNDLDLVRRVLAGEIFGYEREKRYLHRRGHVAWVKLTVSSVRDDTGRPLHFVTHVEDITAERAASAARYEVQERQRVLLSSLPDTMVVLYDRDLRCVLLQGALLAHLGIDSREYEGRLLSELVPAAAYEELSAPITRALAGQAARVEHTTPEGRTYTADIDAYRSETGQITGAFTVWRDITERISAQDQLQDRERQLSEAQALAQLGCWEWDLTQPAAVFSDELCRIAGQAPGFAPTLAQWLELVHPDDRDRATAELEMFADGSVLHTTFRIVHPDGEIRHVIASHYARRDEAGAITHLFGTVQDVSRLRAAEDAEHQARQQFERAFEDAPIGMAIVELNGCFRRANRTLCEIIGYPGPDLVGMSFRDVTHPDDLDGNLELVRDTLAGRRDTYELHKRFVHRDGHPVWAEMSVSLIRDPAGQPLHFVSQVRDVTAQRAAQAQTRIAQEQFRAAFDEAPIGMTIIDLNGRITQVNDALSTLLGYPRDQLEGILARTISHPDDFENSREAMQQMRLGQRGSYTAEKRYLTASRQPITCMLQATVLTDSDGQPTAILSQIQDITERKRHERELRFMADHDPLTGLLNRRSFQAELDRHLTLVKRYEPEGALIVLDIDRFKSVNDTLGHHVGDELIGLVAELLHSRLRESDIIGRLGGDEFAILLPKGHADDAALVAQSILRAVRASTMPIVNAAVTTSIGITVFETGLDHLTSAAALIEADQAMYEAKTAGGDGYAVHRPASRRPQTTTPPALPTGRGAEMTGSTSRPA